MLHVAAQCVLDCNTLLAPFLPHSSNKVWSAYGGKGEFMPMPRIEQVEDLDPDDGAGLDVYPIITGDYSATPAWERRPIVVGTRSPSRPRSSPSSTRPSSTRSWPASASTWPPVELRRAVAAEAARRRRAASRSARDDRRVRVTADALEATGARTTEAALTARSRAAGLPQSPGARPGRTPAPWSPAGRPAAVPRLRRGERNHASMASSGSSHTSSQRGEAVPAPHPERRPWRAARRGTPAPARSSRRQPRRHCCRQ